MGDRGDGEEHIKHDTLERSYVKRYRGEFKNYHDQGDLFLVYIKTKCQFLLSSFSARYFYK